MKVLSDIPEAPEPHRPPLAYEQFGPDFMRLILHRDRVLSSIDRVLGDAFLLGPIGAGPGRVFAKITAQGTFGATSGEALDDGRLGYKVFLPVEVTFDLDLQVDSLRFRADLLLPLTLTMHLEEPLVIRWVITPPTEDEVTMHVDTHNRRSAVLQKLAGLDGELRRFIVRFVGRELEKPHVRKAMKIDLVQVIDAAWPVIAAQFLPNGPEDRSDINIDSD